MERNIKHYLERIYAIREPKDEFEKIRLPLLKKQDNEVLNMMFNNVLDIIYRGQELNIEDKGKFTFKKKAEARRRKTASMPNPEREKENKKLKNKYKLVH
jgi:nucleoid DNA-binding protein